MKSYIKESAKLFGKTILVSLLCFFIVISIMVVSVGFFAEVSGYYVTGTKDGKQENLYTYYLADGEDTQYAKYEKEGYTLTKTDIKLVPESKEKVCHAVAQFFCLAILIVFIYPQFWDRGYRDRNLAQTGNIKGDALKGLKQGLGAIVPWVAGLIYLYKVSGFGIALLVFVCPSFYPIIAITTKGSIYFSQVGILGLILIASLWLIIPAIAGLGYYLGYKDFSIMEKITFAKTK
jgi:hypothetical protein